MAKIHYRVWLLITCIITFVVYSGIIKGDFVSDDYQYIVNNPYIKNFSWEGIKAIFSNSYFSNYHPITTLSWAFEYKIWQLNPKPYHLTNLILHLLNTILVFFFFKRLINRINVSLIITVLFAIHPMHVEAVCWISQRKDLLYTMFFLLSLSFYLRFLTSKKLSIYLFSLLFFIFSLLSKSMAVTLPLLLILIDYYKSTITIKSLLNKIPFFVLSLVFGILALHTQQDVRFDTDFTPVFSFVDRLFLVCYAICIYLVKLILPIGLVLFHYYPIKIDGYFPLLVYISPLFILLIGWVFFKFKSFRKELIFGILFFLISISVVIQFIPAGCAIVSERYTYVPYLGLFFIISMFYYNIQNNDYKYLSQYKYQSRIILFSLIGFFMIVSYNRVKVWVDSNSLFNDLVEKQPDNPYSYFSRSNYLLNFKNDPQAALSDINRAIELNPRIASSFNNRGFILAAMNDFQGSINDFNKAISLDSTNHKYYLNRGISKMRLALFSDALFDFNKSIAVDSTDATTFYCKAVALYNLHDTSHAIYNFNKTLALNDKYIDAYYQLGIIFFNLKDYKEALNNFNYVIRLNVNYADAYYNRAVTKIYLKDSTACDDLQIAYNLGVLKAKDIMSKCK